MPRGLLGCGTLTLRLPSSGSPAPLRLRRVSHEDVALPDEEINDFLRKRRRVLVERDVAGEPRLDAALLAAVGEQTGAATGATRHRWRRFLAPGLRNPPIVSDTNDGAVDCLAGRDAAVFPEFVVGLA